MTIEHLNKLCGQLDEQSTPVLRGAWYFRPNGIRILLLGDRLRAVMPAEETELSTETRVAELPALKGPDLSDAAIDAHGVRITLLCGGMATVATKGKPTMHLALNQRNLSITKASGKSSRMAEKQNFPFRSEWSVNLRVISPAQVLAKAGAGSL